MITTSDILFFDLEVQPQSQQILEIGALLRNDRFRRKSVERFVQFAREARLLCGHNIVDHDLRILAQYGNGEVGLLDRPAIDTLYWSALLFPKKPYHRLVKGYQLDGDELNNPLADAELAKALLLDLLATYRELPAERKVVYYSLLAAQAGFNGFFALTGVQHGLQALPKPALATFLQKHYAALWCGRAELEVLLEKHPVELAYAIALITTEDPESIPPAWILHRFPKVWEVINRLRVTCAGGGHCAYCHHLQPQAGLQKWFGFPAFRRFAGDGPQALQEQVVTAALANQSFIAIFPTGGGKSLTFQLPALMRGAANRALTVIISPLQSLMKDQVDVLEKRHGITAAVTINGMLSPLERTEAIERVAEGGANLLYISPESLRSKSIINLLKRRAIDRFVIDEAHCLSAWGQDFRVDYLYIGPFIKKLQEEKGRSRPIPVSCFTATAKPAVVEDMQHYFQQQLGLEMALFQTSAKRQNLQYFVIATADKQEKLMRLVELLQSVDGPKIVYVSRVKTAEALASDLKIRGFSAKAYHGQLERDLKKKIQEAFMAEGNELDVIVATSAFGMGVDKDNVKMVVHYQISNSLENYIQESGRAGRNPELQAQCFVLFDENDLNGHFNLLNTSKLNFKEIKQIWQGIKHFKKQSFSKSALEIAKAAGWDTEMYQLETRVKTAIAALEEAGYVRREENAPRIFATSIVVRNVTQANQRIEERTDVFTDETARMQAKRIFSSLISRSRTEDDTRVDSMAEALGLHRDVISRYLTQFKLIGLLSNDKDLTAYYYTVGGKRHSTAVFEKAALVEAKMFELLFSNEAITSKTFYLRELNENLIEAGLEAGLPVIKTILNYWSITKAVHKERKDRTSEQYYIVLKTPHHIMLRDIGQRKKMGAFCLAVLERDYLPQARKDPDFTDRKLIRFSTLEIWQKVNALLGEGPTIPDYERLLLYLHRLHVIELKSGLLVLYNPMKIVRQETDNFKRYKKEDFAQLALHYRSKTEQIHIVGEYAKRQLQQQEEAMQFVDDYFVLDYDTFLSKYFPGRRTKIRQAITEAQFARIIQDLSAEQLAVVKDNQSQNILVAAGPGSGKTRVLVHKVAHLLLLEDIKPEQFLMLTFSRPAALEFKTRLKELVGRLAFEVDIFTYHGYAFQLQGRMGDLERSENILQQVTAAIREREAPLERLLSKSIIVVDEFQDVSHDEYAFIEAIAELSDRVRTVVVGDDDQNIYEFRGANIRYMRAFAQNYADQLYYLTTNYRARRNLLAFTNRFLREHIRSARIKKNIELVAHQKENGQIEIIQYQQGSLILPMLEHIQQVSLDGTTAVLTHSNEEALLVTTLLRQRGLPARLIVHKEGFALRNLLELRWFTHHVLKAVQQTSGLITEERWEQALSQLATQFTQSQNLDLVRRVIDHFAKGNPKKFRSEWLSYLRECRIEDFYFPEQEVILVSTMHKAKGKEFDRVFVLLDNYSLTSEERKRVLYVALTRAKTALYVHTNSVSLARAGIEQLVYREEPKAWPAPDTLVLQCGMSDVWLGFFTSKSVSGNIKDLHAGQPLMADPGDRALFTTAAGRRVAKLSKAFSEKLQAYLDQQYTLQQVHAQYIIVWLHPETGREYRVVLPAFRLQKSMLG